ncbi:MAG: TIM barrel protein [Bacteroidetes bacterium]|jgi:sugar phosphate isomerase/epimerase|nr:TIM barrel protein [Bacteroidota bacterium]
MKNLNRKEFITMTSLGAVTSLVPSALSKVNKKAVYTPKYSLSQWALHRMQFGNSKEDYESWKKALYRNPDQNLAGPLHPLDFPEKARSMGYNTVEYVNTFFFDKARKQEYLSMLKQRCEDHGIKSLLLMIDEEGFLGDSDPGKRKEAIKNHKKWVEAGAFLGCNYIRVNAHAEGNWNDQKMQAAEGLKAVCDYADTMDIQILIENHGGLSSHPKWLLETIEETGHPTLGVMNDFDNFEWSEDVIWGSGQRYNRYHGFEMLMPLTYSVSAKAHHFDDQGYETTIDFERMANIIAKSNFTGYVSVEYEGNYFTEEEGVNLTRNLLQHSFDNIQR